MIRGAQESGRSGKAERMRIWSGEGGLMTDEQVLSYIGHFGSLSAALEHGDVSLMHDAPGAPARGEGDPDGGERGARRPRETRLADYL